MFINGRFLTQPVTGVQRFAREIVTAAARHGCWDMASPRVIAPRINAVPGDMDGVPVIGCGKRRGQIWEQISLPRMVGDAPLINLCNTAPLFLRRQMVVLHDAAVAAMPDNFTFAFRVWYRAMIACYSRRAAKIATVSRFSADEIARHFGIARHRIDIIPESGEHILRHAPDDSLHRRYGLERDGYFLAVSSRAAYKNFAGIVKAAAKLRPLPYKFVIVGGGNARVFNRATFDTSGAVEVGYVSDAQLRALYEDAACFVYPSTYEGFGLPPLEAMTCGCPVLASRAGALPETCGDAALYCDPYHSDDIAAQLSRLLDSRAMRDDYRAAGLAHAQKWTWERAARCLVDSAQGIAA